MELGHALKNPQLLLYLFPVHSFNPSTTARAMLHEVTDLKPTALGALEILRLPPGNHAMDLTDEDLLLCQAIVFSLAEGATPGFGGGLGNVRARVWENVFVATEVEIADETAGAAGHLGEFQARTGVFETAFFAEFADLE